MITPRLPWVDPWKDAKAEEAMVNNGFKSRSDVIESLGSDPEETDQRIAEDRERARSLGLVFPETNAAGSPNKTDLALGGDTAAA
jgi:capsid protein